MKRWSYLALVVSSLLTASHAATQQPPEKTMATFNVSPGLEVQLWASEPMFCNPTIMDVDHKGRVWVVESVNYRSTLGKKTAKQPAGDRILILEDTKGTGKADKVTVFYQAPNILAPLGIAVLPHPDGPGCTVYVGQSPDILVFEDKDGDGKADGPPRKLLSGFKGIDHDHGVHGLFIGPENKLYFTVGDQGVNGLVDKHGRKWTSNKTDCMAGTCWRCDLDGKNLEFLAHNFRNHYEMCADSFGTLWVSDNDDDGNRMTRICYVMPGGNYGYHPRGKGQTHWHEEQPGVVPMILRTMQGSPTGMCFYEGTLFPKKYQGMPMHVDAGPGRLSCYHLTDKGAAYTIDREDMLVNKKDSWYRPSDVCVAPDGSVMVADWYDPGVGGHGIRDFNRGRIYRLVPKGAKPVMPTVDMKTNDGIRDALGSCNVATRAMAMAKITKIGLPQALEILTPAAAQKTNEVLRARALWQLGRLGNLKYVNAAFSDPDPRFRILAMRILSDFHNVSPADYVPDWRQALVNDSSPQVRREALLLLRAVEPPKAKPLFVELAQKWDGKDRFYLCAVGITVGIDAKRREAMLGDFQKDFPGWANNMAGLVWELRPPRLLALLTNKLSDPKVPTSQRIQILDVLATSTEAGAPAAVLKALPGEKTPDVRDAIAATLAKNLPGKWASLRKSNDLKTAVDGLLKDPNTRAAAVELIAAANMDGMVTDVFTVAQDTKADLPTRIAAVRALGNFKMGVDYLLSMLGDKGHPQELLAEAVLTLGRQSTEPKAVKTLQELTEDKSMPLPIRQAAVAGLAGTQAGSTWLLEFHEENKLAAELIPDVSRLLLGSPYPALKKRAAAAFPAPPPLDPKNLPSIPALLARKGNLERGKQLMTASSKNDAQCLKCHTINGVGGQVGPDLSTIGSKASRENLLESILYPSRAIADQFQQYAVETKQGLVINGLIIEETAEFLLMRDANVKDYKIKIGDIDSKKKLTVSLMPELIQHLPEQDLLDIVDYLLSLKTLPIGQPGAQAPMVEVPEASAPPRREMPLGNGRPKALPLTLFTISMHLILPQITERL